MTAEEIRQSLSTMMHWAVTATHGAYPPYLAGAFYVHVDAEALAEMLRASGYDAQIVELG